MSDDGFLSRWSRRKAQVRQGAAVEEVPAPPGEPLAGPAVAPPIAATSMAPQSVDTPTPPPDAAPALPLPTMADVAGLTRESDFSRFVAPGVDTGVRNAALKKLFTDPHFNAMDGLDIYIDDYSKPDPLPLASIRKMAQAAFLGLLDTTPPAAPVASDSPPAQAPKPAEVDAAVGATTPESDEDADLRLQPHDAAGCGGAEVGAAEHERRQS